MTSWRSSLGLGSCSLVCKTTLMARDPSPTGELTEWIQFFFCNLSGMVCVGREWWTCDTTPLSLSPLPPSPPISFNLPLLSFCSRIVILILVHMIFICVFCS
ncbi:hypothetical protein KP509_13G084200 [Ceratopteris richardii]|uniref:Uncharacterized protein n=1 Tax=Ceratopteris richardii TaxID=49495 RepID=A0A8T2TKR2_CERRI|nr:hypothetical protein KP509_13G084200 [Ceratopteris richardii]